MRVLMFGWEFPPHNSGGLGVACRGLTRALSNLEDMEITFVLPRRIPLLDNYMKIAFAELPGAQVKFREVDSLLTPYITSSLYADSLKYAGNGIYGADLIAEVVRYGEAARKIAEEESFDIIHAHDWLSFLAGINAKQVSGKPLVVHIHATEYDRTGGNNGHPGVIKIEKEGLEFADKVCTVSGYTKSIVMQEYGIADDKIEVVHNGIDESDISQAENALQTFSEISDGLNVLKDNGTKLVLFLGRFTVQKGADIFIQAAQRVLQYRPNTLFLMVGSGELEPQLINQAVKLGIGDKVVFTGFLRGKNRERIYSAADLFVMPSVSEPFGLVALESLLHETPIIISKQSGVGEVLEGAIKVDFWDVDQMVNMMVSVLEHSSLRNTLSQNGKQEALRSTWDRAAYRCKQIYKQLVAEQNLAYN